MERKIYALMNQKTKQIVGQGDPAVPILFHSREAALRFKVRHKTRCAGASPIQVHIAINWPSAPWVWVPTSEAMCPA